MLAGEGDDQLEEALRHDGAARVVGVVEEHQARLRRGVRRHGAEVGDEAQLGQQRQQLRLRAGEDRPAGVDGVAGVGGKRDATGVEEGEAEVVDALLGADRRDHLALGVDLHLEAAVVELGEGLAKLGSSAIAWVLLVGRIGDRLLHRLDDVRVGRLVGVADAEADHVDAGGALLGDAPLQLGEHVGRHRLQAPGGCGDAQLCVGLGHWLNPKGRPGRSAAPATARPRRPARPSR